MIYYDSGRWGISFIWYCKGSVFPRSFSWALPSALAAFFIQRAVPHTEKVDTVISQSWFALSFVVGFLIVFRTQQGYARYWEGASLLQNVKAYWLNATSNLISFCSVAPEFHDEVVKFQHLLIRLMSLLHCSSLQSVSMMNDNDFEIIESSGLSQVFLTHVRTHEDSKCFIVLQAIQQLIVDNIRKGVLDIPPPIVSRVFQELSNGIVAVTNVRKITDIPFPFPYAQLVTVMLLTSWLVTPFVTGCLLSSPYWASALTFVGQFGFWSINYIAAEIEMPFGDDENDLPIAEMQREMNECLKLLMHPLSQDSPDYVYDQERDEQLLPAKCTSAVALQKKWVPWRPGSVRPSIYHDSKVWHHEMNKPSHVKRVIAQDEANRPDRSIPVLQAARGVCTGAGEVVAKEFVPVMEAAIDVVREVREFSPATAGLSSVMVQVQVEDEPLTNANGGLASPNTSPGSDVRVGSNLNASQETSKINHLRLSENGATSPVAAENQLGQLLEDQSRQGNPEQQISILPSPRSVRSSCSL